MHAHFINQPLERQRHELESTPSVWVFFGQLESATKIAQPSLQLAADPCDFAAEPETFWHRYQEGYLAPL